MEFTDEAWSLESEAPEAETPATAESQQTEPVEAPTKNPTHKFAKATGLLKLKLSPKALIIAAVALVVLIGAFFGIRYATNNYMTPLRYTEKLENQSSIDPRKYVINDFKFIGASNGKQIVELLCQSDDFLDLLDALGEKFEDNYDWNLDNYGDDYRFAYSVEDKVKLEKADLRNYQKSFRQYIKAIDDVMAETEDFTSEEWSKFSDMLGLTRTQSKKLVAEFQEMVEDIGRVTVTDGYELDVLTTITGSMLDEPMEQITTIRVVKANGRWIPTTAFEEILGVFDSYGVIDF